MLRWVKIIDWFRNYRKIEVFNCVFRFPRFMLLTYSIKNGFCTFIFILYIFFLTWSYISSKFLNHLARRTNVSLIGIFFVYYEILLDVNWILENTVFSSVWHFLIIFYISVLIFFISFLKCCASTFYIWCIFSGLRSVI